MVLESTTIIPGLQRAFRAVLAEQHLLDGRGVRDADPYHFRAFRRLPRSSCCARSRHFLPCRPVPGGDLVAGLDQVGGHWPAHDAQPQECDAHDLFLRFEQLSH